MNNERKKRILKSRAGFTLIELMVVMIILGLLAALVVPKMFGKLGKAKTNSAYAQIELFGTALDSYRLDVGSYPSSLEGLVSKDSGAEDWSGPYLRKNEIPLDPWGNEYKYSMPGEHGDYDLYSLGADNSEGGEGENRDVASWKGLN